ncbi:MAG: TolC family protein, partial [Desulfotalea sp.]
MKKQNYGTIVCSFVLITITLCLPYNIYANQNGKINNTVSLNEAISDISLKDPNILESLKTYSSVLAERAIAQSGYYPTVGTTISSGPERTDGVDTGDIEKNLIATDASLYIRQNIYKGGETTAFVNETEARIRAAAYDVLNTANDVYLETAQAYINVIKARDLLTIAEQNALTQEKIMLQVREKTEAGFNRVSELYNSESRLALSKGSFISRQQDLNQALVVFHKRFGQQLRPEQFVMPQPKAQLPPTVEEAVDLAFQTHPALKVAAFNIESSRYAFERSDAKDYPTLDLELRGQYRDDTGGDEGDTTQLGAYLMFNYTFYDGGLRDGEQQRDRQRIRKENQRSYIERRNVNESVRLAWNIKEAEDYKKKYLNEHVQLSAKTLDAFKEEYYV